MAFNKKRKQIAQVTLGFINSIMAEHMLLTLQPKLLLIYEFFMGVVKGLITATIAVIGGTVILHFFRDSIIDLLIKYL